MAGVAGDENMRQARCNLVLGHVVELVRQSLTDLVDRPPGHLLHFQRVGLEDALGGCHQLVDGDVPAGHPLAGLELIELDIQPGEIATLARDDDDVALGRRLYQRLAAYVGEVRDRQDVHDAPGLIGGIANKFPANRFAHRTARAVATDHVAGAQFHDLALAVLVQTLQTDPNRVVACLRIDAQIEQLQIIVGCQPGRRFAHDLKIHVMHTCLVEDDMGHLG